MEISKLIFSKETKNKIKEPLNGSQKGKLRWEKIKESEERGLLAKAKNRYEVANIAGFPESERMKGYQWVANMVQRKHLQEIPQGLNKYGFMDYEYHVIDDPDYSRKKARDARWEHQNAKNRNNTKPVKTTSSKKKPVRERGKENFDKLKELERTGLLAKATSRADVASLVGYSNDKAKSGYSWVSNLIYRGHLKENIIGITPSGKINAEYRLGDTEPQYNYEEAKKRKKNKETRQEIFANENMPVLDGKEVVSPDVIKINITRGDTNINVEVVNSDQAIKLITTILKGE